MEALLDQDSCQTQELARTLGVTQQAISHRLKSLGMIQKQENWVPYKLTLRCARNHSHVRTAVDVVCVTFPFQIWTHWPPVVRAAR